MSARRSSITPEMNVTPLVDVVLVLLIIFMVVTPQIESGASVELPAATNPDKENKELEPTTVSLAANGAIFMDRKELKKDALLVELKALREKKPDSPVVLKADRGVRYSEVRGVFKSMQDLGFPGINLQVIDRKK
ncbi:biopolymer transporter ExbD [Myxococcus sp. CA051A]|uniref:ExbD/TolR family protein n=1 Tax=unclassified Myxococcus TaxID=2648731 RepID=UPI00157A5612|nr:MULTISPECIES: biopolymer transporter ExbD [unclassified Myxococcus]NTX05594.1 biopolymer transporter ExbD [Myxococcus sp. CA040A]NTX10220.1 biopolymer transporter ExbD [Myxococcus sp. CA056]NTX37578.1 biopolymer transporter ExbD [Myxococcus sp. CA033]NTX52861.1 biopolymer transporter ExbD [Myxococcus sp. CA039A]NTX67210.1 biopolymer transporter ExbD [Myxococcus sp. CA051A]